MKRFLTIVFALFISALTAFAQVPLNYQGTYSSNEFENGQTFDPPVIFVVEKDTISFNGKISYIKKIEVKDNVAYIVLTNGIGLKYNADTQILDIVDLDKMQYLFGLKISKFEKYHQFIPEIKVLAI